MSIRGARKDGNALHSAKLGRGARLFEETDEGEKIPSRPSKDKKREGHRSNSNYEWWCGCLFIEMAGQLKTRASGGRQKKSGGNKDGKRKKVSQRGERKGLARTWNPWGYGCREETTRSPGWDSRR